MTVLLASYNQTKQQVSLLQQKLAEMEQQVRPVINLANEVKAQAEEKGVSLRDLALMLCPELENGSAGAAKSDRPRKQRDTKVYTNPHSGEVVETKGGNHKVLKAWKAQYGNDAVESWKK